MPTGALAALAIASVLLVGCTDNPQAPINQTFPVRQMDNFFNGLSNPPNPPPPRYNNPPDYTHEPGYAPAYPPY